jgi:hypothetical protein
MSASVSGRSAKERAASNGGNDLRHPRFLVAVRAAVMLQWLHHVFPDVQIVWIGGTDGGPILL